jgi:polyisoprenoid-binding protein YceI
MPDSLPLPIGTWNVDPAHSSVEFLIRHLGLANVRGRFGSFSAAIVVGEDLASSSVTADIDLTSVNTNNADRDAHLKSTDFFNADSTPSMTFVSLKIDGSDGEYELTGDLTINGVTNPITLAAEFNGIETNPFTQGKHAGFSAKGEIKRGDYNIDFNVPLGGEKLLLGEKVKIELELEFTEPVAS